MTLKQITDIVANRIRDTTSGTDSRIREYANDVMDMILRNGALPSYDGIIRTESGRAVYALPYDVGAILDPMITMEDQQPIFPSTVETFDILRPKPTATGTPAVYTLWDSPRGISRQPETTIRVVSDSASDTQALSLFGISGGVPKSETITLTGTTAVLSANKYTRLTDIPSLASAAVGTVTGTANSTATNNALPTVVTAGNITVFTITAGNTKSTNHHHPGSIVRIKMDVDNSSDRGKTVIVEGYAIDDTNNQEHIRTTEVLTTDATTSTTEVDGAVAFTEVLNVTKGWDSVKTLMVMVDPDAMVVAMIPPDYRSLPFSYVQFYPEPTGQAIRYRYHPKWRRLSNDQDQPVFDQRLDSIWLRHTERMVRAYKQNMSLNIWSDPELLRDLREVIRNQRQFTAQRVAMGSGLRYLQQPAVLGRLNPARFRN